MNLPPDRSRLATEARNPRSLALHQLSVAECITLFQEEDAAVLRAVAAARPALVAFAEAAEPGFVAGGRLVYVGAGTSGRLGVLDASEAPPTFQVEPGRVVGVIAGGDPALRMSGEGLEDDPAGATAELAKLQLTARDTILGIAAGGTTPYVLGALAWASQLPDAPLRGFLTCAPVARPEAAQHMIVCETGPEVVTGSTRMKAGTATKLILNTLSTTLMVRAGKVYENLMVDLRATNAKLEDRAARIVTALTGLDRPRAFELLASAGGGAKTAVVMQRCKLGREDAESLLSRHNGRLDLALGLAP